MLPAVSEVVPAEKTVSVHHSFGDAESISDTRDAMPC